MTLKPIRHRQIANEDINTIIDYYLTNADATVATGFVDSLEASLTLLRERPAMGSERHGELLGIPGLRCWAMKRYPYLIFYIERTDSIDVWRILHSAVDVPTWLQDG